MDWTTLAKSPIFRESARFSDLGPGNPQLLAGPCFLQGGAGSSGFPWEGREMGEGRAQKPVYFPAKPNKPSLPEASAVVTRGDWNSLGLETPEFGRQWARRGKDTNLRPDSSCTGGNRPASGQVWKLLQRREHHQHKQPS